MDRAPFLAEIAARLGRPRSRVAPARAYVSAAPGAADIPTNELAAKFSRELTALHGEVALVGSAEEAEARLASELGEKRVVAWSQAELRRASGLDLMSWAARWKGPDAPDFRAAALEADVGVTGVDAAIADTGTLVLSAGVGRPRSVSLLPRLHIALVKESQLVARMGAALGQYAGRPPSAVHFISGPSRTSDIENDLSIGVHGPARVLAIVIREPRA